MCPAGAALRAVEPGILRNRRILNAWTDIALNILAWIPHFPTLVHNLECFFLVLGEGTSFLKVGWSSSLFKVNFL